MLKLVKSYIYIENNEAIQLAFDYVDLPTQVRGTATTTQLIGKQLADNLIINYTRHSNGLALPVIYYLQPNNTPKNVLNQIMEVEIVTDTSIAQEYATRIVRETEQLVMSNIISNDIEPIIYSTTFELVNLTQPTPQVQQPTQQAQAPVQAPQVQAPVQQQSTPKVEEKSTKASTPSTSREIVNTGLDTERETSNIKDETPSVEEVKSENDTQEQTPKETDKVSSTENKFEESSKNENSAKPKKVYNPPKESIYDYYDLDPISIKERNKVVNNKSRCSNLDLIYKVNKMPTRDSNYTFILKDVNYKNAEVKMSEFYTAVKNGENITHLPSYLNDKYILNNISFKTFLFIAQDVDDLECQQWIEFIIKYLRSVKVLNGKITNDDVKHVIDLGMHLFMKILSIGYDDETTKIAKEILESVFKSIHLYDDYLVNLDRAFRYPIIYDNPKLKQYGLNHLEVLFGRNNILFFDFVNKNKSYNLDDIIKLFKDDNSSLSNNSEEIEYELENVIVTEDMNSTYLPLGLILKDKTKEVKIFIPSVTNKLEDLSSMCKYNYSELYLKHNIDDTDLYILDIDKVNVDPIVIGDISKLENIKDFDMIIDSVLSTINDIIIPKDITNYKEINEKILLK